VILEDAALTAPYMSALLELTFLRVMVTRLAATALAEVCAITAVVFAVASTVTTAQSASIRPSWVKRKTQFVFFE